jgi:hypothetical protein
VRRALSFLKERISYSIEEAIIGTMRTVSKYYMRSVSKSTLTATTTLRRGFGTSKQDSALEKQKGENSEPKHDKTAVLNASQGSERAAGHKTMAELDEEMRLKMSGLSGDGGEAGIEYEDGKPVAMKRSVKNNMFRYI